MRTYYFGIGLILCAAWIWFGPLLWVEVDVTEPGKACELHNIPLLDGIVPISYGLIRLPMDELQARTKLFPHARSGYHGGCVIKDATRARVSFCPECRKTEEIWYEAEARKMAPVRAQCNRIRDLLAGNPQFTEVHPFTDSQNGPRICIAGRVLSNADLAELKGIVEAALPEPPVIWTVRVGR